MNVNELSIARDKAGSRVEEMQNKLTELAIKAVNDPESVSEEESATAKTNLSNAKKARDLAQAALDEERKNLGRKDIEDREPMPVDENKKIDIETVKKNFVKDFKDMVTSGSTGSGNAGLTIPQDIQLQINELRRSFVSLEQFVNVETVGTSNGSRVYEKLSDIKPMNDLDDESGAIGDNDDPELITIKYLIHRYAGITTITNTLLKDTVDNIINWLVNWAAKKDVVTRNLKILDAMGKAPKKVTITGFDNIKDLENNTLDPMIEATSIFITNQSGYNILSKVKDAQGRYMLQRDVTQPNTYMIAGHRIVKIVDKYLPDVSGAHPLYYGDLKEGITLFDRQNMEIAMTSVGADTFIHDTTKLRFIDRFDVEVIDDGAWAVGSFKTVADQQPTTPTTTTGK